MKKTFCDFCGQEIQDVPVSNSPTTDFASLKLFWGWGTKGVVWELHEDCAKQLSDYLEELKKKKGAFQRR